MLQVDRVREKEVLCGWMTDYVTGEWCGRSTGRWRENADPLQKFWVGGVWDIYPSSFPPVYPIYTLSPRHPLDICVHVHYYYLTVPRNLYWRPLPSDPLGRSHYGAFSRLFRHTSRMHKDKTHYTCIHKYMHSLQNSSIISY